MFLRLEKFFLILIIIVSWIFSGYPQIWQNPPIPPEVKKAQAATTDTYTRALNTNANGYGSWTVPAGVTSAVVACWGGGGGGVDAGNAGGGGGGGGAFASSTFSVTLGTQYTIFIAGTSTETTNGANTTFGTTTMIVAGGKTGLDASPYAGGAGGAAADTSCAGGDCDVEKAGGQGGQGDATSDAGGGGGGAGGPHANGVAGSPQTGSIGGAGGAGDGASPPGGAGGAGGSAANGSNGTGDPEGGGGGGGGDDGKGGGYGGVPGGGGGGGDVAAAPLQNGAPGKCTVTYTVVISAPTVTTSATVDSITQTSATLNGNITATGGADATEHGFAYGTVASLSPAIATTTGGAFSGTGAFTSASARNISGLTCNTVYYYRAYATNSGGTGYGTILNFTTSACAPTVTTNEETNVTSSTATLNGEITATGGENATQHGFASSTDPTLTTGVSTSTLGSFTGTGTFNENLSGLAPETTYYFRAYATNSGGTSYGSILSLTTAAAASLTLIVDTDNFPSLTPGTPRFATSTVSVDTNNSNGWYVTLERQDADTTLDRDGDTTVDITDQAAWTAPAATTTHTGASSVKISSFDNSQRVLAFRVMTASSTNGSMFFSSFWWGSADNYIDNVNTLWAGIPAPSSNQKIGISSVNSGGSPALNTVLYYLDVPNSQKTGAYSGNVIFTAVMN